MGAQPCAPTKQSPPILSITELTTNIREILEGTFTDIWIVGEVTNFRNNRTSRHWYFGLKDEGSQINAIMFNASSLKLTFQLEDGLEVICHGRVNVYPPRGSYSIIIDQIEPKGVGALQLAFEQLKKKLHEEGLFAKERKKPIPFLPKKVGVITSPTGAAIRDIIHVMTRRFPGISILLSPVKVQGEGAALEIAQAIHRMNQRDDLDVLIVGRGGGSLEDLWAFNEEPVARAIFASRIPIISAVGHEIDFTIADFVADVRAATPSAAAEMIVPVKAELQGLLIERKRQLMLALQQTLTSRLKSVQEMQRRLKDPSQRFPDLLLRIDGFRSRASYAMENKMDRCRQHFLKLLSNLNHLSPLAVLSKGYAVVQKRGSKASVKSTQEVTINEELDILLHEGKLVAVVKSTK
ncbi:MAG: hypothetical protein A3C46_07860 [Deltaproteobacteria bacterium RIFCSPHIGHO2_02_FULL_44_16]|nr:MAG: hypothetical protein A3C46_07860 [Deltaproteobacteria bacterium RIFCSPHIGHO2_02_FULL_44_16]